jgi:hypothetical protein
MIVDNRNLVKIREKFYQQIHEKFVAKNIQNGIHMKL